MKGLRRVGIGVLGTAAALLAVLAFAMTAQAQDETIAVSDGSATPGGQGEVTLEAQNIGGEGLGAWTIDITYDASVVSVVDCSPQQGGVCNPEFADDTIRVTGASATGLDGDTLLASITFECGDAEGTSDLGVSIDVLADATVGNPQPIDASTSDGSFACEEAEEPTEEPPAEEPTPTVEVAGPPEVGTGAGSDSGSLQWLIVGLAAAGLAGVAGFGALRVYGRRA